MKKSPAILTITVILALSALLVAAPANGVIIDNDVPSGTLGHWSVDVTTGGESRIADLTANRFASGDLFTEDVLFDYFSYVDPANDGGGFQLSGSAPVLSGDDEVTSSGSFAGMLGNTIDWTVTSSIPNLGTTMTSVFTFTAQTGTLGMLRFIQYMDEDIESVSDDVFFTRGSVGTNDLELFTVDNTEVYGVSHSGALDGTQGLVDATFAGWAADEFNDMKPTITGVGQAFALAGVIDLVDLPGIIHPQVGAANGPADIVSALAWDVNPQATTATIITTLGGVPDVSDIPDDNGPIPEPGTMLLIGSGLMGMGLLRRRMK